MSYMLEISNALAETLKKFATLNRHQLAGQVGNLDFWTDEVRHCLSVIDGYHHRFETMKAAQVKHAVDYRTSEFALDNQSDLGSPVPPPKPVPDSQLKDVRRALCEAFYGFVVCCHKAALLDEGGVRHTAAKVGISIDSQDLKR
jgi:hypothetical protein